MSKPHCSTLLLRHPRLPPALLSSNPKIPPTAAQSRHPRPGHEGPEPNRGPEFDKG